MASVRFHAGFPNVPLTKAVLTADDAGKWNCDSSKGPAQPGDTLWSNRNEDVDILDIAMACVDVRFHPQFGLHVPLTRREMTPADSEKITCDVTNQMAPPGSVLWSNHAKDIDVLDMEMPACTGYVIPTVLAVASAPPTSAVEAANLMGVEILQMARESSGGSAFVSPVSIYLALAMTVNGARGGTKEAMISSLYAQNLSGVAGLNSQMQNLILSLASTDPRVAFYSANSVWSPVLSKSFVQTCWQTFKAEARTATPEPRPINDWCSEQTNGKITEVLDPAVHLDASGAVLVNALYFKGQWKDKFDVSATVDAEFRSANGQVPCKMMVAKGDKGKFQYFETGAYQAVALPYGDKAEYSAMLLLPRSGTMPTLTMTGGKCAPGSAKAPRASSPNEVLSNVDLSRVQGRSSLTKGILKLPRFKAEFGIDLKSILEKRGMAVAFTPAADFSDMSDTPLMISNVIHKTFVEVNEEGTEAAAVTAVVKTKARCSRPAPEPVFEMVCDRPFVFCIRQNKSNVLLFCGVVETV